MDLRTHLGVVWRWKFVVGLGLLLAVALAFFSVARVDVAHGFSASYRDGETWKASETLLVNQRGLLTNPAPGPESNPGWLTSLTSLYAQIANSSEIKSRVFRGGITSKATGDYTVWQVFDQNNQPLSVLTFEGTGNSRSQAAANAKRASFDFRSYVNAQASGQQSKRVLISVLSPASVRTASLAQGHKFTTPILVFLAVLLAALGLAYVLENLVPRKVATEAQAPLQARKSAPARRREPRKLERLPEPAETSSTRT
jgi:hypothetical protein